MSLGDLVHLALLKMAQEAWDAQTGPETSSKDLSTVPYQGTVESVFSIECVLYRMCSL
jgi:hypothetical protein